MEEQEKEAFALVKETRKMMRQVYVEVPFTLSLANAILYYGSAPRSWPILACSAFWLLVGVVRSIRTPPTSTAP